MNVAVDVIDTVTVAVHVHGNATVIVIQPVDGAVTQRRSAPPIGAIDPTERRRGSRQDHPRRQGKTLHDRERLGDGVRRAPRRYETRGADRRRAVRRRVVLLDRVVAMLTKMIDP